jgi:MFS family permease
MSEMNEMLTTRWVRAAERAPRAAFRQCAIRVAFTIPAILGALHLCNLALWGWRSGQGGLIAFVGVHVLAVCLAVGLPVGHTPAPERSSWFRRLFKAYADRADRLRALGRVLLLEVALLFLYPPLMTLMAGNLLRWPAEFVVAVAACMVVWPLQRIAASQRAEASRLSALDR